MKVEELQRLLDRMLTLSFWMNAKPSPREREEYEKLRLKIEQVRQSNPELWESARR